MNFEKFLTFFKQQTALLDCEVITRSINMYCYYYKCFQAHKIVKYLRICSTYTTMVGFHTEFKGDAIMLGVWGHVL